MTKTKIFNFIKDEAVLLISFILALISAFFVAPSKEYVSYIDFATLGLLFCLMAVMAGLNSQGVFERVAKWLLKSVNSVRGLAVTLCLLCFFSSMVITNDVALITFVPFTILALKMSNQQSKMILLITVETVAANLGSMLTPIGNPQNLYLYSAYNMQISDFASTMLPYGALSLVGLLLACLIFKNEKIKPATKTVETKTNITICIIYAVLFVFSLLTVFRVLNIAITFAITVVAIIVFDIKNIKKIDYSLLFTFVFLFVFIGNLGKIPAISTFLSSIITSNEVIVGVLASQVFSNVPAALLLSGFSNNANQLLIGVNLGGLGTLIASMASLISFKFIAKEKISTPKYIAVFTVANIVFLAANLILWVII